NRDYATGGIQRDPEPDLGGGGVFGNIVQGFLDCEEKVVARVRGERARGHVGREVQPTANACRAKVILGVFAQVGDQARERVMFWVYSPHDFVHGSKDYARRGQDLMV